VVCTAGVARRDCQAAVSVSIQVRLGEMDGKEWRKLLDAIPTETGRDPRDRALIATLT